MKYEFAGCLLTEKLAKAIKTDKVKPTPLFSLKDLHEAYNAGVNPYGPEFKEWLLLKHNIIL